MNRILRQSTRLIPFACLALTFLVFLEDRHLKVIPASKSAASRASISRKSNLSYIDHDRPSDTVANIRNESKLISSLRSAAISDSSSTPRCLERSEILWSQNPNSLRNSQLKCDQLFKNIGNEFALDVLLSNMTEWTPPEPHNDSTILEMMSNCTEFLRTVPFAKKPGTKEEEEYPLAYVFVAHRNAAQTIRLFRMLYQPQNAYCLTYDTKSDTEYTNATVQLSTCFPSNVYLTPQPEPIYYFGYSILHSVTECMKVLIQSPIRWKYVQVVSWNDFPLRTNWELVNIFKILNGSQDSELMQMNTPEHYTFKDGESRSGLRSVPPAGLKIYKGSFATSMTREFINFTLHDPISIKLYEWLSDAKAPEEFYWPTLIHNLQVNPPGGFPGECEPYYTASGLKKTFLSRYQTWIWENANKCKGTHINWSCVYGIKDLPTLVGRPELIAHKLYEEHQSALLYCLEEWHWGRACPSDTGIITKYYENLPSVRYHGLSTEDKEKYLCTI